VQFVAVGLVLASVLAALTGWFSQRAARDEAVQDARSTTELLAQTVVAPAFAVGPALTSAAQLDRFDRLVQRRLRGADILRVKLWDETGTIVYSDEPRLIGEQFVLGEEQRRVLAFGGTEAEVSDLSRSENVYERPLGQVLEVYTRVEGPQGQPLMFELYYSADDVAVRTGRVRGAFLPIAVGGILIFLVVTVPLVWLLARRLDDASSERERLLLAAAHASDAERRRIARDLHDGVVQDLAGTSFALSASARELSGESPLDRGRLRQGLEDAAVGVRQSLRALRSLLVEIYPPDLSGASLPSALDDLLAPAAASGVAVTLALPGDAETAALPDAVAALLWRTAQECVRNALRHGRPQALAVRLVIEGDDRSAARARARLEVDDDGVGFDPELPLPGRHFGLRGLRDLAAEAGGSLLVTSAPHAGTSVVLEVPTT
jgi:signal transduction histidine kinase